MSYEEAQEILSSFFPVKVPIRSLERIVADVYDEVDQFYEDRPAPQGCPAAEITVATVDKKGIVIRKPNGGKGVPPSASGNLDKPGKKKMATVISTYVTERHFRTIDDIVREMSDEKSCNSRPKSRNKMSWGSLTHASEKTVARLKKAVDQRLPDGNELVCILDGERSVWALVYAYFPAAFFVLDIFHVLEHLGKAALLFHDEDSPLARQFVTERLQMLLWARPAG